MRWWLWNDIGFSQQTDLVIIYVNCGKALNFPWSRYSYLWHGGSEAHLEGSQWGGPWLPTEQWRRFTHRNKDWFHGLLLMLLCESYPCLSFFMCGMGIITLITHNYCMWRVQLSSRHLVGEILYITHKFRIGLICPQYLEFTLVLQREGVLSENKWKFERKPLNYLEDELLLHRFNAFHTSHLCINNNCSENRNQHCFDLQIALFLIRTSN